MKDEIERVMAAECLAVRVRILGRVVSGIFDRKLRSFGVRSSQINILVSVAALGPVGQTEICRRLCLEKSSLSRELERLIAKGWIVPNETSGRARSLAITPNGRKLIRRMKPAWDEAQIEARQALGHELTEELHHAIDGGRLAKHVAYEQE